MYKCGICEEPCSSIERHILQTHQNEPFLECPDCGFICESAADFAVHFEEHEDGRQKIIIEAANDNESISLFNGFDGIESDDQDEEVEPSNSSSATIYKRLELRDDPVLQTTKLPKAVKPVSWQKHDNKERPFKCDICGTTFTLATSLKLHTKRHLDIKPHQCSTCDMKFVQSSDLQKHERTHSQEKPYICNFCGLTFTKYYNLNNHMKMHTESPQTCKYCDKTFQLDTSLRLHLRKHEGPNVIRCTIDECQTPFTNPKDLTAHIKRAHSNGRPYLCSFCPKSFSRSCDLVKHRRIHLGEKLFNCKMCDKSFTHQTSLRNHQVVHTKVKPFQCSFCGQLFSFAGNLKTHIRTHTGERNYECSICGKKFGRSANLNEHIKIHTGERPFGCQQCKKSFRRPDLLASHIKTHSKSSKQTNVIENDFTAIPTTLNLATVSVPQPTELFQVHLQQQPMDATLMATDDANQIPEITFHTSALIQQPSADGCQQFIQFTWT